MSNLSIQQALDYCLENPDSLSAQELLDRFPQYRAELADMLGFASELTAISPPPVPTDRREAMKSRLMLAAQQHAAAAQPTRPTLITKPVRPAAKPLPIFLRPGWLTAAAAILVVLFTWWSADRALPDSPFYNVKLASENIMLNLTSAPVDKAILNTNIANARLYDLRSMQQTGKLAQAAPALESYAARVTESNNILLTLQAGEPRARVAQAVYKTCLAGKVTIGGIQANIGTIPNFPVTFSESLQQTETTVDNATQSASNTLVTEGIDPATIQFDPSITSLLTPVASTMPVPGFTVAPTNTPAPLTSGTPTQETTATPGAVSTVTTATITIVLVQTTPTESSIDPATETPAPNTTPSATGTIAPSTSTPQSNQSPTLPAVTSTSTALATSTTQPQRTPTGLPTLLLTPTLSLQTSTSTATSIPGTKVTATPNPTENIRITPTNTATPTSTTIVLPGDTAIPTPAQPIQPTQPTLPSPTSSVGTPTSQVVGSEPSPTITPTATPTNTPTPTPTSTPTDTPTATIQATLPPPTPIPPTLPPTQPPTNTHTPTATTPPSPTPTEPTQASVCDLKLDQVNAECANACASWSARITNDGDGPVEAEWVAELEVKAGPGGFQVVDTTSGSVTIGAGSQVQISDPFCGSFPPNATQFRVRVHLVTGSEPCNIPAKTSSVESACPSN